jgi:hypothetical protein
MRFIQVSRGYVAAAVAVLAASVIVAVVEWRWLPLVFGLLAFFSLLDPDRDAGG